MSSVYNVLDPVTSEIVNRIIADADFMLANFPEGNYQLVPEPPAPPPPAPLRRVTQLAFRNRFTPQEKISLEIASLDDPSAPMPQRALAASIRVYQADVTAATFIDLDRADTRAGVQALEVSGILAAGRASEILDNPVQPLEEYRS